MASSRAAAGATLRPDAPPYAGGLQPAAPRAGTPTGLRRRSLYASQRSVISIQSRDPRKPPQFFFVNPMNVAQLTGKHFGTAMSQGVRFAKRMREFSEKWFSHLMLVLVLLIYCFMGAALFRWIEAPYELEALNETVFLNEMRANLLDALQANLRNRSLDDWKRFANASLLEHERAVFDLDNMEFATDYSIQWTFPGSLFYCMTIVTTLGYGNISPSTTTGKIATIFYGIVGIPLLLMVLADLGKLFTRWIKWLFFVVKHFYRTGTCARKGHKNEGPVQYVAFVWQKVNDKMTYVPYPAYMKPKPKPSEGADDTATTPDIESRKGDTETGQSEVAEDFEAQVDDEFNLPVSVALIILSLYMTAGAILFTVWEPWDFTDSFYFVFISMSTVGFGDLVPEHPIFMMATFIYLLFGLALTSMCINVVQEKLSAIFQKAKMQLGTTIGFDPTMLSENVIEEEPEEEDALSPMAGSNSKSEVGDRKGGPPVKIEDRKRSLSGGRRSSKMQPKKPEINIDELIQSGKGIDATKNMQNKRF